MYTTLLMRDQESIEKGTVIMIENALRSTKSIQQTAGILQVQEEMVRKIAEDKGLYVND